MSVMDYTQERFAVRETAAVLGCSTFVIYSMFKGKIEGGLTVKQLEQVRSHISKKGFKPYKYKAEELDKIKMYIDSHPGEQQHIKEEPHE